MYEDTLDITFGAALDNLKAHGPSQEDASEDSYGAWIRNLPRARWRDVMSVPDMFDLVKLGLVKVHCGELKDRDGFAELDLELRPTETGKMLVPGPGNVLPGLENAKIKLARKGDKTLFTVDGTYQPPKVPYPNAEEKVEEFLKQIGRAIADPTKYIRENARWKKRLKEFWKGLRNWQTLAAAVIAFVGVIIAAVLTSH